ncbi:hypothetical protein [Actinoplanes sp. NPDC049265]|uniref:hypothetical protein n=1 Tax=Actinoplanes sp. NPDC049265 TaxID=3363902 RepID=UPI00371D8109
MNEARTWWASGALGVLVLASSLLAPRLVAERREAPDSAAAGNSAVAAPNWSAAGPDSSDQASLPVNPSAPVNPSTPGQSSLPVPRGLTPSAPLASQSKPQVAATSKAAFRPIRIAAAAPANKLVDVEKADCPTCASGSRVQYVGQGHAVVLRLRDVPVGGRRTLVIVYESENTRPLDLVLPDGTTKSLTLPGRGNWITPARFEVRVDVPAGDSEITFFHATDPAPDLDQFILQ